MTHICVGNTTIIGSDNGLSPGRRQAINWTNAGILSIGPLGTNFSENLIEIYLHSRKCISIYRLDNSGILSRPQCFNSGDTSIRAITTGYHFHVLSVVTRWREFVSVLFVFQDGGCLSLPCIVCIPGWRMFVTAMYCLYSRMAGVCHCHVLSVFQDGGCLSLPCIVCIPGWRMFVTAMYVLYSRMADVCHCHVFSVFQDGGCSRRDERHRGREASHQQCQLCGALWARGPWGPAPARRHHQGAAPSASGMLPHARAGVRAGSGLLPHAAHRGRGRGHPDPHPSVRLPGGLPARQLELRGHPAQTQGALGLPLVRHTTAAHPHPLALQAGVTCGPTCADLLGHRGYQYRLPPVHRLRDPACERADHRQVGGVCARRGEWSYPLYLPTCGGTSQPVLGAAYERRAPQGAPLSHPVCQLPWKTTRRSSRTLLQLL